MVRNLLSELSGDLFETKMRYKGFNLLFLSQVLIGDNYLGNYKVIHIINIAKKFGLENVLKFLSFKFYTVFSRGGVRKKFDYLFVNEVNNAPVMRSLNLVLKKFEFEKAAVVFSDMRIAERNDKSINIFEYSTFGTLWRAIISSLLTLLTVYKEWNDIIALSRKYRIKKRYLLLNLFDSILLIEIVNVFFEKVDASKIVLMTDVHKLSRIIVLTAKRHSIPTFVIQHGAAVGEAGYLPIISDKMLVWGESSKQWFISKGQSRGKLEIVGSPRMDSVIYQEMKRSKFETADLKKMLIIMSEVSIEEDFLITIKNALINTALNNVELIIKLHPGGAVDYSFMPEKVFCNSGLNYKILRFEDTKKLLEISGIVFVTTSSVGMEAIIQNKPLFLFKSKEHFNHRMSYEDFDCSHIFETSDQLSGLVSDVAVVFSKIKNYPRFVSHYYGKLDGNSSLRAAQFIRNYSFT